MVMKLTGFLFAAFSMTFACSVASAFADLAPLSAASATENAILAPEDVVTEQGPSAAVTPWERLGWFDQKTFGISNLGGSLPGAAWMTFLDRPHEAGPHWQGFAERYGVSVSTNAVSNAMEAGLGAIWGEDPRYARAGAGVSFKARIGHIAQWTVVAPGRDGELHPAYARFMAISGSSFISNAWREPSDTGMDHSLGRIGFGLLGRMGSNAFEEFWPDAKKKLFRRDTHD
jgi:hypothetical protein